MAFIDFTPSNATPFYLSIGNPSGVKGLGSAHNGKDPLQ